MIAALVATGVGCSGSSTPSAPSTPASAATDNNGEPTTDDWTSLVAQLAAIGVDNLVRGLADVKPAALVNPVAPAPFALLYAPLTNLFWGNTYLCCSSSGPGEFVQIYGRIDLHEDNQHLVTLTETFDEGHAGWNNKYTIKLSTEGLKIVADLDVGDGQVAPRERFRLVGQLTYLVLNATRTAQLDVVLEYANLEQDPPRLSGRAGSATFAGQTAPRPNPPQHVKPCPPGPEPGVPANPGCYMID